MPRKIDLTGKTFGRWTVIAEEAERNKHRQILWKCRCDCGTVRDVSGNDLRRNHTRSCGCLRRDITTERNITHGMTGSRFFRIYNGMIARCKYVTSTNFNDYGGRGIKVCDRWQTFENFRDDMYADYLKHVAKHGEAQTSIDRIDNDGDYEKSNCLWATRFEQSINKRISSSNKSGVTGVYKLLDKRGWTAHIKVNGKTKHLGTFTDFDLAVKARKDAEEKYFYNDSIA